MSLKQQAIKGISWNLIERFGLHSIKLFLSVWLARLLTPADYGLVGMISVLLTVATVFVGCGLGKAYVQKKKVSNLDSNTIFYSNLFISLVCYTALWAAAPPIAAFYDIPQLVNLIRVMSGVVIINAFSMIQMAQLTRAIDFKRKTKITLTAAFASSVAGITAAYLGSGIWSLVLQLMLNRILTTMGLWMTSSWRPSLNFSMKSFRSLFSFGAWLLAGGIVRNLFENIHILAIGKLFPVAQLGFYNKANQFKNFASGQLASAVGVVAFPVFSRIQDESSRLKEGGSKILTHTMVFIAPLLVTLMVVAEPFVLVLLTDKWAPMIPYMQLLCIAGFLQSIHWINIQVMQAKGKSKLIFRIAVINNSLRVVNISLMYHFGMIFIIIGEIVTTFIALVIITYYTRKLVGYGLIAQFKDIGHIMLPAVVAGVVGFTAICAISNQIINIVVGVGVSLCGYVILQYVFNRLFFMKLLRLKANFVR
jgi:O-antigen/teichoic acid export membrane protein